MISVLLSVLLVGAAGEVPQSSTEKCAVFYHDSAGNTQMKLIPGLHVSGEEFRVPELEEGKVTAVMCGRDTLIPQSHDWTVLKAGLPLTISSGNRVMALEIEDHRVQARMLKGEFKNSEIPLVEQLMDDFQEHLNTGSAERVEVSEE